MTDTEIAAAVAELTEAIRAKGCQDGYVRVHHNLCDRLTWTVEVFSSPSSERLLLAKSSSVGGALSAVKESLHLISPQKYATELFRAALEAAREAGVDVAKIVGAGEICE